ncbi:hypothetical protein VZT92_003612 [Zoarces viviparus]|uniref:Uncharacterized protein n=1 Tax=Zoarces viviparus TaxID=48416 RepID=A0AAW1FWB4_ZOAVI
MHNQDGTKTSTQRYFQNVSGARRPACRGLPLKMESCYLFSTSSVAPSLPGWVMLGSGREEVLISGVLSSGSLISGTAKMGESGGKRIRNGWQGKNMEVSEGERVEERRSGGDKIKRSDARL